MSKVNTDGGLIFTLELEKDTTTSTSPQVRVQRCGYNFVWTARPNFTKEKNYVLYPTDSTSISKLPEAALNHLNIFVKNSRKLLHQHNIGIKRIKNNADFNKIFRQIFAVSKKYLSLHRV